MTAFSTGDDTNLSDGLIISSVNNKRWKYDGDYRGGERLEQFEDGIL